MKLMKDFIALPGPEGPIFLRLNLALIEALEQDGEGLYRVAERLVQRDIGVAEMIRLLKTCYCLSGRGLEEEALDKFLLARLPELPELLTEIFLAILEPVGKLGGVQPGEFQAAPAV